MGSRGELARLPAIHKQEVLVFEATRKVEGVQKPIRKGTRIRTRNMLGERVSTICVPSGLFTSTQKRRTRGSSSRARGEIALSPQLSDPVISSPDSQIRVNSIRSCVRRHASVCASLFGKCSVGNSCTRAYTNRKNCFVTLKTRVLGSVLLRNRTTAPWLAGAQK